MVEQRSCAWMTGPKSVHVPAHKWWFAISRDVFAQSYRRQAGCVRPPVSCKRTPTFSSPLRQDG